ncbi:rod shape-determining protein MreD [Aestuariibius insulae]|uniref:rod shape-determining protein MreD n=1 Tax=Aestuariibius insulae TaxID=2058287 RepID=UPI00345E2C41
MAETPTSRIWSHRLLFAAVSLGIIFFSLVPINAVPSRWIPPDLLLALAFAWVARRPDFVPVWLIAIVFLLTDFLFQRPPGLWAAWVVIGTEILRSRTRSLRNSSLLLEWLTAAGIILVIFVGHRISLTITFVPLPPLGRSLLQVGATILAYPLVAIVSHLFFGVKRTAPGEVDSFGHRL